MEHSVPHSFALNQFALEKKATANKISMSSISLVDGLSTSERALHPEAPINTTSLPDPPPNGGLTAWTQVAVGHLLVFNGFGYISSFGIFQAYYATTLNRSASDISWVGSIQLFLLFLIGTLSGRAMDAGYFRSLIVSGCALQLLGVFATSWCTQYWQLFLAQGLVQGLGNGLLFTPTVVLVSTYFSTKRAFALGLTACGAPTGGVVFPLVSCTFLSFCELSGVFHTALILVVLRWLVSSLRKLAFRGQSE